MKKKNKTKQNWQSVFPPSVAPLSNTLWSRAVMYPERGTTAQMYHDRDTFDFSEGHETKNQPMRQFVFSWVKV